MKTVIAVALMSLSALATAEESNAQGQPAVEAYDYSTKLDIATVISSTPVPDICGVAPMKMTYEDSQGQLHIMSYLIMGNGCPN
jgi:hypothetical protein